MISININDDEILKKWDSTKYTSPIRFVPLVLMIALGIWLFYTVSDGSVNDRTDFLIVAFLIAVPLAVIFLSLMLRFFMKKDNVTIYFKNSKKNGDNAYLVIRETLKKLGYKYRTEEKGLTTVITSYGHAVFVIKSTVEPLEINIKVPNKRYLMLAICGVTKDNKFQVEKLQKELYLGLINKGIYIK